MSSPTSSSNSFHSNLSIDSRILEWTGSIPPTVTTPVHTLIQVQAEQHPQSEAVVSWDVRLTYAELDALSTRLSRHLMSLGISPERVVLIGMEKSPWVVVCILAVLKAGGVFVLLDVTQPVARLQTIMRQAQPLVAILASEVSAKIRALADGLSVLLFEDINTINALPAEHNDLQPPSTSTVQPKNAAYLFFTSGSTGTPKGVVIEHAQLSTSCIYSGIQLGFGNQPAPRVLQLTSYAFDPCILEIITTLVHGGTVCVPTAWEAKNGLSDAIRRMDVTCVVLTPTLLSSLSPLLTASLPPTLNTLIVGGERIQPELVDIWAPRLRLMLVYGPTECCVLCFIVKPLSGGPKTHNGEIGHPVGARAWIVKEDDYNELAPVGGCGELLIEGPLVARGYLGDPRLTEEKFIESPNWMPAYGPDVKPNERMPRLYRTGDLVKYQDDGSICCIGRIDNQVKIRGQRLELEEVEQQLYRCMAELDGVKCAHITVEAVTPLGSKNVHLLAFVCFADPAPDLIPSLHWEETGKPAQVRATAPEQRRFSELVSSINTTARRILPAYAIPSLYVPMSRMPLAISGKTDRKELRTLVAQLSFKDLSAFMAASTSGISEIEQEHPNGEEERLRILWAELFGVKPGDIGANDSFFSLGGDSVMAMRMVASGRTRNVVLNFETIFKYPILHQMAQALKEQSSNNDALADSESPSPFSMISDQEAAIRQEASSRYRIAQDSLQDIYPCSSLQTSLVAASLKSPGAYMMQVTYQLPQFVDLSQLQAAWGKVCARTQVMRTRFIDHESSLLQAVIDEPIRWECIEGDLPTFLVVERQRTANLGAPMSWFTLLQQPESPGNRFLVWTIHHALMDGWTASRLESLVESEYYNADGLTTQLPGPSFASYIQHIHQQDDTNSRDFWKHFLRDAPNSSFPRLPGPNYKPHATETLDYVGHMGINHSHTGVTAATLIQTAWSLLVGIYSDSPDVIIGITLNGRTAQLPDIHLVCGPTINTVPFRSRLDPDMTVEDLLRTTQQDCVAMLPFAHYGLQKIQRASTEIGAATACNLQSILVIQSEGNGAAKSGAQQVLANRHQSFSSIDCALMIECTPYESGRVTFRATFDANILTDVEIQRIFQQFEHLLKQLSSIDCSTIKLSDLQSLSEADHNQILQWNSPTCISEATQSCVHELFEKRARDQPDAPALCAWDGDLSYGALDEYSSRLAGYMRQHYHINAESLVAICFEKSQWTVVAMLAVLKAGGVCVPLDPNHPMERLRTIIKELGDNFSGLMLTSSLYHEKAKPLGVQALIVDLNIMKTIGEVDGIGLPRDNTRATATPSNAAFVIFTSGSTGVPKGIVIEHRAFCSSALAHGAFIQLGVQSRVLQFAAHTVDISIGDMFATLIHGGCVCIPSEHDKMNNLSAAMEALKVNHANLTPTVASQIQPEDVPNLKVLVAAGEMLTRHVIERWSANVNLINMYGPAECSVYCAGKSNITSETPGSNIGKGVGAFIWIVDREDMNRLSPIGGVGELVIEGPGVARGYLGNEKLTSTAFIQEPAWAVQRGPKPSTNASGSDCFYKTGDLGFYNVDGSITLVGRRSDNQAKLHGQRFETGEVEYRLRECLAHHDAPTIDVAVSLVRTLGVDNDLLAAFLAVGETKTVKESTPAFQMVTSADDLTRFDKMIENVKVRLDSLLPSYMVPSLYIPISEIPLTVSGKVDRRRLRDLVSIHSLGQLSRVRGNNGKKQHRPPSTETEMAIRDLWMTLLRVDQDIGLDDDFFRLGGDSVLAMRLVSLARRQGVMLTVDGIFKNRRLVDLALAVATAQEDGTKACKNFQVAPFSLLPQTEAAALRRTAAEQCGIDEDRIEDIYPCTAFQERWMLGGERTPDEARYFQGQAIFEIPAHIDADRFRAVWDSAIRRHVLLRTRLIQAPSNILQVIVNEQFGDWRSSSEPLQEYLERDKVEHMDFGCRLLRLAIVEPKDEDEQKRYFVFTAQHAIYDGVSLNVMFEEVQDAYLKAGPPEITAPPPPVEMRSFIKYLMQRSRESASLDFWTSHLAGAATGPILGNLRPEDYRMPNQIRRSIKMDVPTFDSSLLMSEQTPLDLHITLPTIIQMAIGLVFAHHSGRQDVILRMTRAGRSCGEAIPGVEDLVAPAATVVPVRVHLDPTQSALDLLRTAQRFQEELTAHEHLSLLVLQRMPEFQDALHHTLHVNIMSQAALGEGEGAGMGGRLGLRMVGSWMRLMGSYGVIVEIEPGQKRLELKIASDPGFVAVEDVMRKLEDIRRVFVRLFEVSLGLNVDDGLVDEEKDKAEGRVVTVGEVVGICQKAN
jgi:amino acid adenylation domain-containing protein